MAVTIGRLAIQLSAQTAFLKAGFAKARMEVGTFTKSVGQKMATLRNVLIGTFAVVAGGSAIRRMVNDIDDLGKASTRLGLSVGQLQDLEHAAQLAGVSTNTLRMALQRMGRRISQAADGSGEAVKALQELGLSARELERKGPAKAFEEIADRVAALKNPLDRVRIAQKLFDSEGVALVNVLRQGSQAVRSAAKELDELGRITEADTRMAADFNDALLRVTQAGKVLFVQLSRFLVPILTQAAQIITAVTNSFKGMSTDTLRTGLQLAAFAGAVVVTIRIINRMIQILAKARKAWKAMTQVSVVAQAVANPAAARKALAGLLAGVAAAVTIGAAFDRLGNSAEAAGNRVEASAKQIKKDLTDATKGIKDADKAQVNLQGGLGGQRAGAAVVGTVQGFSDMMKSRQALERLHTLDRQQLNEQKKATQLLNEINGKIGLATLRVVGL